MKKRHVILSLFLLAGMISCSQLKDEKRNTAKSGTGNIVAGKIIIAAHRGGYENDFADKAPENSIANIQNAINHGFEIYETDIHRTSDGKWVIMHDPTLERTTNGTGKVSDISSVDIKKLRLKYKNGQLSDEKVPFLVDFISKGDGKIMFKIDYKPELEYLGDFVDEIKESGFQDRVIIRSRYKKEMAEKFAKMDQKNMPIVLFRVSNLKKYNDLREILKIKIISIDQRKKFTDEQLQIIKLASDSGLIVEAHTFYANNTKKQEELWAEQVKLPITIWHTKKPSQFQEFLKKNNIR
ncbi:MAG: glycerophosphodiester phosphodiesterase family protein [Flavobacteriales bacterium]|nr:glycerophosphodiester phosphodiesterase family protein [Flavobacteriales bacterium]